LPTGRQAGDYQFVRAFHPIVVIDADLIYSYIKELKVSFYQHQFTINRGNNDSIV